MRIVTLVENSCGNENCIAEHGLSIYIETEKHKLLLDTGQTDAVVRNAEALGVDLIAVTNIKNRFITAITKLVIWIMSMMSILVILNSFPFHTGRNMR